MYCEEEVSDHSQAGLQEGAPAPGQVLRMSAQGKNLASVTAGHFCGPGVASPRHVNGHSFIYLSGRR